MTGIAERLRRLDWKAIEGSLWEHGYAKTPPILTAEECAELVALYGDDGRFRSRVDMARYRFGLGEYKYFAEIGYAKTPPILTAEECAELVALYGDDGRFRSRVDMARYRFGLGEYKYFAVPLPAVVQALRVHAYPFLAPIAGRFTEALGSRERFPSDFATFLAYCARHGQRKPTPLLLRYEAGGYNCLHQDLYGEVVFPLQLTCLLSRRGADFEGGEFLLVEQRPRAPPPPARLPL